MRRCDGHRYRFAEDGRGQWRGNSGFAGVKMGGEQVGDGPQHREKNSQAGKGSGCGCVCGFTLAGVGTEYDIEVLRA